MKTILENGIRAYEEGDCETVFEMLTKACDTGNAEACFRLGVMYEYGRFVQKDLLKAAELFIKACNNGNDEAYQELVIMYENGKVAQKYLLEVIDLIYKRL
jgi:hypothetical protein